MARILPGAYPGSSKVFGETEAGETEAGETQEGETQEGETEEGRAAQPGAPSMRNPVFAFMPFRGHNANFRIIILPSESRLHRIARNTASPV